MFGGQRTDRHGHLLAQAFVVTDGSRLWLQDELIGRGLARVYSLPDNRACVAELLVRERAGLARLAKRSHDRGEPSRSDRAFAGGRRRGNATPPSRRNGPAIAL